MKKKNASLAPNARDQSLGHALHCQIETTETLPVTCLLSVGIKYALTRNLKTQVLSVNAYRYPMEKLQKPHELFEVRARVHDS